MTIFTSFTILIMLIHWIGDFVFQSHWMATNKSKSNIALFMHVSTYSITLFIGLLLINSIVLESVFTIENILLWTGVNYVLHFVTDFFTSRGSSYLYAKGDIHNFFVVIGLDQWLHLVAIMLTSSMILF